MNQKIGYIRASIEDESLYVQRKALAAAGCEIIYEDSICRKRSPTPELASCLNSLRPGDTLVVWRLDRLGRSIVELVKLISLLVENKKVGFVSLQEQMNASDFTAESVSKVFRALAACERDLVRERTNAGLKAARARGRLGGRKPKLREKEICEIKNLLKEGLIPVSEIAKRYGVSRTTIYNHIGVVSVQDSSQV